MTAGGLEASIAKAATSAVSRMEMPDADGNPQVRYLVEQASLYTYDQPFVALRVGTGELERDVGRTVVAAMAHALRSEPVTENVLLFCEAPDFFLGGMARRPDLQECLAELSSDYRARIQDRPFIWHDVRRVLNNALSIDGLIDVHGVSALYLMVGVTTDGKMISSRESIYSGVRRREIMHTDELAAEIVGCLTSRTPPWIHGTEMLANSKNPDYGHDSGEAVNRGDYFAAALLLKLPLIEHRGFTLSPRHADPILDDIAEKCKDARFMTSSRDGPSPQEIRDALVPRAVPEVVTDFVVRWANREFSLLAVD